jgi:hypothetical protein
MVIVYHSWTESHRYIDQLITTNNTIIFTNPAVHPFGKFGPLEQRRFHIENLCEALLPNSFCFVNETKTIYLMTNGFYDPNKSQIITSVNETVVSIAGDDIDHPVEDLIIDNVAIYAALMWGIYLDDGSSGIVVSNNVVYNTGWAALSQKFGANNTIIIPTTSFWRSYARR